MEKEIKKPIYKKETYPFENFIKLMDWAKRSSELILKNMEQRKRKLANWEKEEMH